MMSQTNLNQKLDRELNASYFDYDYKKDMTERKFMSSTLDKPLNILTNSTIGAGAENL